MAQTIVNWNNRIAELTSTNTNLMAIKENMRETIHRLEKLVNNLNQKLEDLKTNWNKKKSETHVIPVVLIHHH